MMLFLGSDHGGYALKQQLLKHYATRTLSVEDCGTFSSGTCDYPLFVVIVAKKVQSQPEGRGVLICTSGVGMCIAANKFKGIYAACLTDPEAVIKARQHNGINVLCLPGNLALETADRLISLFLSTNLDLAERHQRRRQQIAALEA